LKGIQPLLERNERTNFLPSSKKEPKTSFLASTKRIIPHFQQENRLISMFFNYPHFHPTPWIQVFKLHGLQDPEDVQKAVQRLEAVVKALEVWR